MEAGSGGTWYSALLHWKHRQHEDILRLDHSIDLVTRDLVDDVFGESNTLKQDKWLNIAHLTEFDFIF